MIIFLHLQVASEIHNNTTREFSLLNNAKSVQKEVGNDGSMPAYFKTFNIDHNELIIVSSYIELEFRTFDLAYYGQMKSSLRKLRF